VAIRALIVTAILALLPGCGRTAVSQAPPIKSQYVPSSRSAVVLAVEPQDRGRRILRELRRAQDHIFLCAYILSHTGVIHALERAANEGVDVYVLLERHPYGMGRQPEAVAGSLQAAGVHVRWASDRFTFTHAKYLVIDDRAAIISTANFSRAGLSSDRDFLVIDRLPRDVRAASNLFRMDWDHQAFAAAPGLITAPTGARTALASLMRGARASIEIYAEEIDDVVTERLLTALAARGIQVRVIVPPGRSRGIQALLNGHVAVRALSQPYAHAKAIIVDGHRGFLGSENISATSLDRNRELGLLIEGRPLSVVAGTFARDWARATPP
jgi:cardiolipin synthase A/B